MSDYTNSNLLFNKTEFNVDVHGEDDKTQSKEYMDNQLRILKENRVNEHNKNKKKIKNYESITDKYDPIIGYMEKNNLIVEDEFKRKDIKYLNIDSRFRRTSPSLITDKGKVLGTNPITLVDGYHLMHIRDDDHNFSVGDIISVENIITKTLTLRTIVSGNLALEFNDGSKYATINLPISHGIAETYVDRDIVITIEGIKGGISSSINNIPINFINRNHSVLLTKPSEDGHPEILYDINKLHIELPFKFDGSYTPSPYNFRLTLHVVGGISTGYLNAKYPLDYNTYQGYFIIKELHHSGYHVNILKTPTIDSSNGIFSDELNKYTINFGGLNVKVSRVEKIIPGYSNPNNYMISLSKGFNNVHSIRLVSSEFPNPKTVIKSSPPEEQNNLLYWQNSKDGTTVYNLAVEPGSYTQESLKKELEDKFYATERIVSDINLEETNYTNKQFMDVLINESTNNVEFKTYREAFISKPFVNIQPDISDTTDNENITGEEEFEITVNHSNHGIQLGDKIVVKGAIDHMGIPEDILNGEHTVNFIVDSNAYTFKLPKFNFEDSVKENTKGGVAVYIYVPSRVRFRFDFPGTIGKVLGFRDVGSTKSITSFTNVHSNRDQYEMEKLLNLPIERNLAVNLSGYSYMLMVIKELNRSVVISNGKIKDSFAKILLNSNPGTVVFNGHIDSFKVFYDPIMHLSELTFQFYTPDGDLVDFSGLDHSFTLEVITLDDRPKGSGISSKTGKILDFNIDSKLRNN